MTKYTGLQALHTPFGVRSITQSVAYCNRCGMCASVCPSYQKAPQESNSPRGRNQALRLLLEGKLKIQRDRRALEGLAFSCTLCGRCTQVCPGKIPTAQHMLELRRRLHTRALPRTLQQLMRWRQTIPWFFSGLVKGGVFLKRLGVGRFVSFIPGWGWIRRVDDLLPVRSECPFRPQPVKRPTLIYVPSLEAEFLLPQLAHKTYDVAAKKHRVTVWKNVSSGLFEYVYGDVRRAQKIMRGIITRHAHTGNGKMPLLTDSVNVFLFWKQAPQLFEGFPAWQAKAQQFVACVRFVTDYLPKKLRRVRAMNGSILEISSSLFACEGEPFTQATQILQTHFKKNFVQCGYKQAGVPPFGYGFVRPQDSCWLIEAVRTVASHQAQQVFVLDGLAALELENGLRQFYPTAQVCHIVQLG